MNKETTYEQISYEFLRNHLISDSRLARAYKLTPSEVTFIKLLLIKDDAVFYEHFGEKLLDDEKVFNRKVVKNLYDKEIVTSIWKVNQDFPEDVQLEKGFEEYCQKLYRFTDKDVSAAQEDILKEQTLFNEIAQEFFSAYPATTIISGSKAMLKSCNKPGLGVKSVTELKRRYLLEINGDVELHKKIISALTLYTYNGVTDNPILKTNIVNFVVSHGWEDLIRQSDGF